MHTQTHKLKTNQPSLSRLVNISTHTCLSTCAQFPASCHRGLFNLLALVRKPQCYKYEHRPHQFFGILFCLNFIKPWVGTPEDIGFPLSGWMNALETYPKRTNIPRKIKSSLWPLFSSLNAQKQDNISPYVSCPRGIRRGVRGDRVSLVASLSRCLLHWSGLKRSLPASVALFCRWSWPLTPRRPKHVSFKIASFFFLS